MAHFRKLPVVIEASQWLHHGDHPAVRPLSDESDEISAAHNITSSDTYRYGWIETLEGGHVVSPGDWIIKGVVGEYYPCKPHVFSQTYEPFDEGADT